MHGVVIFYTQFNNVAHHIEIRDKEQAERKLNRDINYNMEQSSKFRKYCVNYYPFIEELKLCFFFLFSIQKWKLHEEYNELAAYTRFIYILRPQIRVAMNDVKIF